MSRPDKPSNFTGYIVPQMGASLFFTGNRLPANHTAPLSFVTMVNHSGRGHKNLFPIRNLCFF